MKKKKLRELTDADIASCEPESIWLETRKCPLPAHVVMWSVVLMLITGVIWACVAKVDKVIAAEGKLVTTRPDITLKPMDRTIVRQVHVRVGQVVEQGDVLVSFDHTINEAELNSLQTQLDTWQCQQLRLKAELDQDSVFTLPDPLAHTQAARTQQDLWEKRQRFFNEKMAWYNENITRYAATAKSVSTALAKYNEMMGPMGHIEDMYTRLAAKGMTAQVDVFQVQMQRMSNEIEIENQRASLVENQQQELSARAEQRVFEKEWFRDCAQELVETEMQISTLKEKIREIEYLASVEDLKAPCRSVVHEIAPFQEGSAIREAEAYITLIPLDVPLEAQVDILPKDVGLLRTGDTARVKLDAFPFQQHGTLEGCISFISANTYESIANQEENPNPGSNAGRHAQYRANLTLSGQLRNIPEHLWKNSGMKLRAEIKVGERTVISYLLNPFIKAMDEAIREP